MPAFWLKVLLLALSLVPWPLGVGCGVLLALRVFVVPGFVFEELVYGILVDFAVVLAFGQFCGILRVVACPPGGEIFGMYFWTFAAVVFHPGG